MDSGVFGELKTFLKIAAIINGLVVALLVLCRARGAYFHYTGNE